VLSRLHEERSYGPFKGDPCFVGLSGQLLALLSSACAVIATLRALMESHSGASRPPGLGVSFSVVWSAAGGGAECLSTRLV